jgi:hypothetical protein
MYQTAIIIVALHSALFASVTKITAHSGLQFVIAWVLCKALPIVAAVIIAVEMYGRL